MLIDSYDSLKFDVERSGGVKCYNMKTLREAHGAGKLGTSVIVNISARLLENGMAHFPNELSLNQWEDVRVYIKASQAGAIIEAVKDVTPTGDIAIKSFADVPGRTRTIERIKELVSEL